MPQRPSIHGSQTPTDEGAALERVLNVAAVKPQRRLWNSAGRIALILVPAISGLFSILFFLWVNLGHLYLPARFTFPVISGERQGRTVVATEIAAASGKATANNIFNRETAVSEANKQKVAIEQTAPARAAAEALVQAETIRETAPLQATSDCIRKLRTAATMARADCYGTGTAGGECDARGDVIAQLEESCGSLAPPSDTPDKGATP